MTSLSPKETARVFCRMVRARSDQHAQALELLGDRVPGQMIAILRQELDSLVRVIYLLHQPESERDRLLRQAHDGEQWTAITAKKKYRPVTDREMVELADTLTGWSRSAYRFGCAFIHLSRFHDYSDADPLAQLPDTERHDILRHMRSYHGSPTGPDVKFKDLIVFLPEVFKKIRSNLEHYVRDLEENFEDSKKTAAKKTAAKKTAT